MFDFLKRKKDDQKTVEPIEQSEKPSLLGKLRQGLSKTRRSFASGLSNIFLGKKELTKEILEEIEIALLTADVGVATTERLIKSLTEKLARKELNDTEAAFTHLKAEMKAILAPIAKPFIFNAEQKPNVILMVGINGSGKTTTIGKLAHLFQKNGQSVMLAAGDTFRAAAIEQLQEWGNRNNVAVIAQQQGADTAAVVYDALEAAKARKIDILLADTAGRLHTQTNLMAELQKVKRVIQKIDPTAPDEVMIVLDAGLGQNALNQVKQFHEAIGVTGIVLTKLDGTAKGGMIFAIAEETHIPVRFIGLGEKIDDLKSFEADSFVDALFE